MDHERAETFLRLAAEAELRRSAGIEAHSSFRLNLVSQALLTAGAVDDRTVGEIYDDLRLATFARSVGDSQPEVRRRHQLQMTVRGRTPLASRDTNTAPAQIVPVGRLIRSQDGDDYHDLTVLACRQDADGASARLICWTFRPPRPPHTGPMRRPVVPRGSGFTATDDRGASYQVRRQGERPMVFEFQPDPPSGLRWLDFRTGPGAPELRISLDQRPEPADLAVTRRPASPGELVLDGIAARLLAGFVRRLRPDDRGIPTRTATDWPPPGVVGSLGDVVAALRAAAVLPPSSPVPGQLAGLCERFALRDHGIPGPGAASLPESWEGLLARYQHLEPYQIPARGTAAFSLAQLPELDGARFTFLGVQQHEHSTGLALLAGGAGEFDDWGQGRLATPMPQWWIRDDQGRWHVTGGGSAGTMQAGDDLLMCLSIVPPLAAGTTAITLTGVTPSVGVRARVPLRWLHPEKT